jgi:8-oxo-dGTP pyrophosphatase MutT (NUDIX family)
MPTTTSVTPRVGARVLLLDPLDRVLLIHARDPEDPGHHWWELPGGGLHDGEDLADASCTTDWDASRMTVQIAVRLDDVLAENARAAAAAAAAGTNLSEWVRSAIRQQAALATALRARAEEDTGPRLYTDEQEDALLAARCRGV